MNLAKTSNLEYLGRSVRVVPISPSGAMSVNSEEWRWLRKSAVMVVLPESWSKEATWEMLAEIVKQEPVAIMITGKESEIWFEKILSMLSHRRNARHTMTYLAERELDDAIEEFLRNALPSEERFDEWEGYAIFTDRIQEVYAFFDAEKINADEN